MNKLFKKIYEIGIVPVVAMHSISDAVNLSLAMQAGGIPVIEITYRTAQASDAIKAVRKEVPNMIVGAGTILTKEQADSAKESGALFVVSPGYDEGLVAHCQGIGLPIIPGVSNASQVQKAIAAGLSVLKFFPAEPLGGVSAVTFLGAPFPQVRFLPAGGVVPANLGEYLHTPNVFACGGGFMCRTQLIEKGDFAGITEQCRQAVLLSHGFTFAHVGLNFKQGEDALKAAEIFDNAFGTGKQAGNSSIFAGNQIELMKTQYLGEKGHLGFAVNSVERAIPYLQGKGYAMQMDTLRKGANGLMESCYLKDPVGGFALHIVRKK